MRSRDQAIGLAQGKILGRNSVLFPAREERERWDDLLTRRLAEAKKHIAESSVIPKLDQAAIRERLANFDFSAPVPIEELLQWTIGNLERGLVQVTHPRYFGLFNPAPTFPAQCADRIAGAFNPQLATATTSPFAVEVEAHVIHAVARRAGLPPQTAGHFTTGGSEANYTSLILALSKASEGFGSNGARAFEGQPMFYVSQDSHLAWLKIAHQAGVGRCAVCLIATDGSGRMDPNALADAVQTDRRHGRIPVMIVATAGTTNAGVIDPLPACAAIAREARVWYHVDAAWGGALIASDKLFTLLVGLDQADSVTIDAHKWLATTMCCGMFLTRWPAALSSAFQVSTINYMPSNVPGVDPYVTTAQWSRRFLGLRLFLSLAAAGWRGYAEHVERAVALIKLLELTLAERGWFVANDAQLAVLCVRPPPGAADVRSIVRRVVASGRAWVAVALFQGREVVRICLTNAETEVKDIMALANDLEAASMNSACVDLHKVPESYAYKSIIDDICSLGWPRLTEAELTAVAGAYYYFSIQFRENLEIACRLHPADPLLKRLAQEECYTDNLSPWPGVADPGEKLDHDEFMKRLLKLSPVCQRTQHATEEAGEAYLSRMRAMDATTRASSIASYEDGGLERVFRSILACQHWDTALLRAFRHFLVRHIAFDNNPDQGHGALARHLQLKEGVDVVWREFKQLLTDAVPGLGLVEPEGDKRW